MALVVVEKAARDGRAALVRACLYMVVLFLFVEED